MNTIKPANYHSQFRPEMLPFIPAGAKTALDIGCGEGHFGASLKSKGIKEVWGIELDPTAAARARSQLTKLLEMPVEKAVSELPLKYFDVIIANDILEHLIDPVEVLVRLKPHLSNNGILVCSIPNVRYLFVLKELLWDRQWKYRDEGVLDRTHLRFFTKRSMEEMFRETGFDVLSIQGINGIRSWKFGAVNALTLGMLSDSRYMQFSCAVRPVNNS